MELSFLLQDGHVNKLRFCSEVLCQKKKKKRSCILNRTRIHDSICTYRNEILY